MTSFEYSQESIQEPFMRIKSFKTKSREYFYAAAVSPNNESIVCVCKSNKLVSFPFGKIDILLTTENHFQNTPFAMHASQLTSMDVCTGTLPLVVTVGLDKLVRIVNHENITCVLHQYLSPSYGDPIVVALHPCATILAIAFQSEIRLFDILHDRVSEKGRIAIRRCADLRFSHGGQFLACCANNNLSIYSKYPGVLSLSLHRHIGAIKSLRFSIDGSVIFTAGADGAVFAHRLTDEKTIDEICFTVGTS